MLRKIITTCILLLAGSSRFGEAFAQSDFLSLPRSGEYEFAERMWTGTYFPDLIGGLDRASSNSKEKLSSKWDEMTETTGTSESLSAQLYLRKQQHRIPKYWSGFCNGWAIAASLHALPKAQNLTSPSGKEIQFSSTEVQALLTYYYATQPTKEDLTFWGSRCDHAENQLKNCAPLTALEFHQALGETVGKKHGLLIADIHADRRVDNRPIVRYETQIISNDSQSYTFESKVTYLKSRYFRAGRLENARPEQEFKTRVYRYRISTNELGFPIESAWLSRDRPEILSTYHGKGPSDAWAKLIQDQN